MHRLGFVMLLIVIGSGRARADEAFGLLLRGLEGSGVMAPAEIPSPAAPSPGVSFLLSALVPGAGQIYQGRPVGWAFVAGDAATWTGYALLKGKGRDLEDEYQAYADEHYDLTYPEYRNDAERGWYEWWAFFRAIDPSFVWADTVYWHDIRDASRDDRTRYYQDIGAANAYIFGWDDWAPEEFGNQDYWWQDAAGLHFSYVSERRDQYRRMRAKADNRLRWASRLVGVALVARAATAIEALHHARERRNASNLSVAVDWTRPDPALVVAWRSTLR